jgi:hypothetical protein
MSEERSEQWRGSEMRGAAGEYHIQGEAQLQQREQAQGEIKMHAYAFDRFGKLLGDSEVGGNGRFSVPLRGGRPGDVELVIGPADDPKTIRQGRVYSHTISGAEWKEGRVLQLSPFHIPIDFWWWWWLRTICVTGHVYKVGDGTNCPVPFVKVEIYDVDREGCWWDYIWRWWPYLIDRKVANANDLLRERPPALRRPFTPPGPGPVERFQQAARLMKPGELVAFNPQPDPPAVRLAEAMAARFSSPGAEVSFNPQPDPPGSPVERVSLNPQPLPPGPEMMLKRTTSRLVGEVSKINPAIAQRLSNLTIVSQIEPWLIFPWCFYSKQLVCTTYTREDGSFSCCFPWFFLHVRNGRLRFDWLPDIIIKVTQTINGIDHVIYMDPYTSTRWDVTNANNDLYLTDPQIVCGGGDQTRPPGTQTFYTLVGLDEVYLINQTNGLYSGNARYYGPLSNVAYGGDLNIFANFGQNLSDGAHYYRMSYSSDGINFTAAPTPTLMDTRVNKITNFSESHTLGPMPVGIQTGLYEVRDFNNYAWYNPDLIYQWDTIPLTSNTKYTLRLEVFDNAGNKLTSATVDYLDGTVAPPNTLPPSGGDYCDLKLMIDNDPVVLDLEVPAAINDCGVVECGSTPDVHVSASQPHNRLYAWSLWCEKGVTGGYITLSPSSDSAPGGIPNVFDLVISGTPIVNSFPCDSGTCVCAFALTLYGTALVRDGYVLFSTTPQVKAIAVEKCA